MQAKTKEQAIVEEIKFLEYEANALTNHLVINPVDKYDLRNNQKLKEIINAYEKEMKRLYNSIDKKIYNLLRTGS